MSYIKKKRNKTPKIRKKSLPGSRPGSFSTDKYAKASIRLVRYSESHYLEKEVDSFEALQKDIHSEEMTWIDICGLNDHQLLRQLATKFDLHSLAIADVVDANQRAKSDIYTSNLYVVLRMISDPNDLITEQLSVFVGKNFVITIQEKPGDCLEPIRERLRNKVGMIRSSAAGYLAYAIMDAVVDIYFPVLEKFADHLDHMEEKLLEHPESISIVSIHDIKKELLVLKGLIWGHRDLLYSIVRETPTFFSKDSLVYIRDCYDHTIQQLELIETYRDVGSNLMDLYFSSADRKANEIMKLLTVVASIFIPLTFIAGIYGMNFNTQASPLNMPELNWYFGYPTALGLMISVAAGLLIYFRKKKWI